MKLRLEAMIFQVLNSVFDFLVQPKVLIPSSIIVMTLIVVLMTWWLRKENSQPKGQPDEEREVERRLEDSLWPVGRAKSLDYRADRYYDDYPGKFSRYD